MQLLNCQNSIKEKEYDMSFNDANDEVPRKTLVMFFLIDVSGSMYGEKIGCVNDTMRELLPEMKDLSDKNPDAIVKLAVMKFSYEGVWETPFPVDFDDYNWNDLVADGPTALGDACKKLNDKLSREEFLQDKVGHLAPVIILLSDGEPNDDFSDGIEILKRNGWFNVAIKVAIGIGSDYNKDILIDFTGSKELVIDAQNSDMLKKMIKFVAVKSSEISSSNGDVTDKQKGQTEGQKQMIENVQDALEEAEDEGTNDIPGFI